MIITRGTALAATVLAVAASLTACGSSGGTDADASATKAAAGWFQVRPVLAKAKTTATKCAALPTASVPNAQPIGAICSDDDAFVYGLGPAVIDENQIDSVGTVERRDTMVGELGLTPSVGATSLETMTTALTDESSPRNAFAIVIDDKVVTTDTVRAAPITTGKLEVVFTDPTKLDPFTLRAAA